MGSIAGVSLGGVRYVVIAEWLSAYTGTLSGVIFAALLLLVVLARPAGLVPYRPKPPRLRWTPPREATDLVTGGDSGP
jgi:ABC-type branched-subunit amino acid transport system permease subunit